MNMLQAAPAPPPPALIAQLTTGAVHLQAGKMFQLAAYVMVVYDNLITLGDEVERIWSKPMSGASILFLLNRHLTPLEFMPVIIAFHLPSWTKNVFACEHFVRYEGGGTLALVAICEIIMMLRVYALWGRNSFILAFLVVLWLAQVIFCGIAMAHTILVPLPPGFIGCILTGSGDLWTPFWVMPLITDFFIFILTMWKTRQRGFNKEMPLLSYFRRDGIVYFICICAANIINVCFFFGATEDLKAIGASFSQLITSVMVNRLVLNLRGVSTNKSSTYDHSDPRSTEHSIGNFRRGTKPPTSTVDSFTTTLIGNLGEDVMDGDGDGDHDKLKSYEMQGLGYYPPRSR